MQKRKLVLHRPRSFLSKDIRGNLSFLFFNGHFAEKENILNIIPHFLHLRESLSKRLNKYYLV